MTSPLPNSQSTTSNSSHKHNDNQEVQKVFKYPQDAMNAGPGEYPNQIALKHIHSTRDPKTLSPSEIKTIDWAYQEEIIKQLRKLNEQLNKIQ